MMLKNDTIPNNGAFWRRWGLPVLASLLANIAFVTYIGNRYGIGAQNLAPQIISLRRIHLVEPPQTAIHPEHQLKFRTIQKAPKPHDRKPQEALTKLAIPKASPAGAKRVPQITPPNHVAPAQPNVSQEAADRDPFRPDTATNAYFAPPKNAQKTTVLPSNSRPQSQPPQTIASAGGNNPAPQAPPSPTPPSTGAPVGPAQTGSGGNGLGSRGTGVGSGGIGVFGLGGSGGEGRHEVVYILDISGSMTSRIVKARQELREAMSGLSENDMFDIIAFSDTTMPLYDYLEPATPDDVSEARDYLNRLNVAGGTNLEAALSMAVEMQGVNQVFLITDGVPTVGETDFKTLGREVSARNINHVRIDVVGLVGKNPDGTDDSFQATKLLKTIASDSGGEYRQVILGVSSPD